MGARTCEILPGCNQNHHSRMTPPDFHMRMDPSIPDIGVIRADHVIDQGMSILSIHEDMDWNIPAQQFPAFMQKLRSEVDRIERDFMGFLASVHPITRRTEPGEPDHNGIGGGL